MIKTQDLQSLVSSRRTGVDRVVPSCKHRLAKNNFHEFVRHLTLQSIIDPAIGTLQTLRRARISYGEIEAAR